MYNRYIRNDQGGYSRIPVDEDPIRTPGAPPPHAHQEPPPHPHEEAPHHAHQQAQEPPPHHHDAPPPPPPHPHDAPPPFWKGGEDGTGGISGFLRRILDKFHLESVDTGDVLLLLILFFLFKEDADDELLIALGLLLIL